MLSLMGIPPLLGFIPKFNTIINSIQISQEIILLIILLVIANSINTIIYIKPIIPIILRSHRHLTTRSIIIKNVDIVT
ncbi:hypothetical protein JQN64_24550 [Escherichia coli]|nr:hypothetical protein [Escherichia coli]